jgi:hypothetical protein
MQLASIGFRAKTGRAIAVAVSARETTPIFVGRWEVALHDPRIPATGQPYHEVMALPWPEAEAQVLQYARQIEAIAIRELGKLKNELHSKMFELTAVGIVGSPSRNLVKIGNPHIRAHAAEGILFRRVLEVAAQEHRIKYCSFSEKDLGLDENSIKAVTGELGRNAAKPWRADERAAAAAAWRCILSDHKTQGAAYE